MKDAKFTFWEFENFDRNAKAKKKRLNFSYGTKFM